MKPLVLPAGVADGVVPGCWAFSGYKITWLVSETDVRITHPSNLGTIAGDMSGRLIFEWTSQVIKAPWSLVHDGVPQKQQLRRLRVGSRPWTAVSGSSCQHVNNQEILRRERHVSAVQRATIPRCICYGMVQRAFQNEDGEHRLDQAARSDGDHPKVSWSLHRAQT